jgi:hypothetical protein
MSNLYRGPPIDASYLVMVHLARLFQRRRFLKIGQSETRLACGGHICKWIGTKCTIFIEELPYMLPTKLRFIWLSSFRKDFFRNQPIRNKNCLWQPCLLTDREEMSTFYRGHSIDASYDVSVHLPKRFQRRRFNNVFEIF